MKGLLSGNLQNLVTPHHLHRNGVQQKFRELSPCNKIKPKLELGAGNAMQGAAKLSKANRGFGRRKAVREL